MIYRADLSSGERVTSVGYLARGYEYPRGEVSDECFDRLVKLVMVRLVHWFGFHNCDLDPCGSGQDQPKHYYQGQVIPDKCSTDILVPGENLVYVAPALILHYIRCHKYLPPACFLDAVMGCAEPGSDEYIAAINKVGLRFFQFPLGQKT